MKIATEEVIEAALDGSGKDVEYLIECLEPLIKKSIRSYYYRKDEFEDLVQEGRLKVLECLRTYDPDRGVHFLGYVKMSLKFLYLNMKDGGLVLSIDQEDGEGMRIIDGLASDDDIEEDLVLAMDRSILQDALGDLTIIERKVIYDFYIEGKSMVAIAEARGVSYRTVVNNKSRALAKLEEKLNGKL